MIYFHSDADKPISWVTFDSTGHIIESATQVPLETVPYSSGPVLIPGTEVILTQADIPSKQWQRIVQAVPYALEDQLIEEVEQLHFALGKRDPISGCIAVAVIAKLKIATYLQQLNTIHFSPTVLIPDILAVPQPTEGWGILFINDIVLVRTGLYAGFAIESHCLSSALAMALIEYQTHPPQHLVVFSGTQSSIAALTDLQDFGIPITEKTHEGGGLAWLVQGLFENKPLNLLQGDYRSQSKIVTWWRPWRLTAALLVLLGGIQVAKQWEEYQQLFQQRQFLNTQIEKLYRDTFPQTRKVVNPRVQMEQQLTALRAQQSNPDQNNHFLYWLDQLSTPLQRTPGFKLKHLDFRQRRFEIQLEIANLQALESLKQRLTRLGFAVEIQSATSHNRLVKTRLHITHNDS